MVSVGLATLEQSNWSGGIASHIEGLSGALRNQGVHVETAYGVGVQRLARFHPFQFYPTLLAAMRNLRGADIVHAHDPRLVRLGGSLRRPVVTTFHGYMPLEMRALNYHAYDLLVRACQAYVLAAVERSDALIAVDNRIMRWLWKDYGASDIHMIPNGVDTVLFHPPRERGPHPPRVLFAKAMSPKNGFPVAEAAMSVVKEQIPDVEFWVTSRTKHADMPTLIRSVDVVLVPSVPVAGVEEATSCLALEAMAAGRTVIASDLGGLREIIKTDDTGILVPPGDAEVLADETVAALQDDPLREYLGRRAREYVVANHTWAGVAQETMKVYEQVLGE